MRFVFYYPALSSPSGGLKQLRLMALELRALGVETYLMRPDPNVEDNHFYALAVPELPIAATATESGIGPEDVLVLPESHLERALERFSGWNCRKAISNMNGFLALSRRPNPATVRQECEFAIVNAPYVAAITQQYLGMPSNRIFLVPHLVVRGPFAEPLDVHSSKRLAVCYMPRKRGRDAKAIREDVARTHPNVPWIEIHGMAEPEVARTFSENWIFCSTQTREGCPLPSLEAMSRGCLVAGYPGTEEFPHPYALPENGFWAKDGAIAQAAACVRNAIDTVRSDSERLRRFQEGARRAAERFSVDFVRKSLTEMLDVVASREYAGRNESIPSLGLRGTILAQRIVWKSGRRYWRERARAAVTRLLSPSTRQNIRSRELQQRPGAGARDNSACRLSGLK